MLLSKFRCLHEIGSVALFGVLIRWIISTNPYSGKGKPPMFGDFEAQRHWMEITYNLPVSEWYQFVFPSNARLQAGTLETCATWENDLVEYHNSTANDLSYWGLDYPPLTAYHSWICGFIANRINSSWIALPESRGIETESHKVFMRATAIIADLLIYMPAICALGYQRRTHHGGFPYIIRICAEICVLLLAPPQILIDHGHFQYNCVSLGLTAWAILFINDEKDVAAAVLFSLALNYKHMSLYLALPFFFYLLGRCHQAGRKAGSAKLVKIGVAVIGTFILCWWPYLWNLDDATQVVRRLFPFSRGIFEDKVANVWCALNIIVKLHRFNTGVLAAVSTFATLFGNVFSSLDLFRNPNDHKFKYALVNSALAFFLFSFQVHEKGILLAVLPATLLLTDDPIAATWFIIAATFSMFPLLLKDGLALPTYAMVTLFLTLSCTLLEWKLPRHGERVSKHGPHNEEEEQHQYDFACALMTISVMGFVILSLACQFAPVYQRLPDLWTLLLSVYSCGHFVLFLVYFHVKQFEAQPVLHKQRRKTMKAE